MTEWLSTFPDSLSGKWIQLFSAIIGLSGAISIVILSRKSKASVHIKNSKVKGNVTGTSVKGSKSLFLDATTEVKIKDSNIDGDVTGHKQED